MESSITVRDCLSWPQEVVKLVTFTYQHIHIKKAQRGRHIVLFWRTIGLYTCSQLNLNFLLLLIKCHFVMKQFGTQTRHRGHQTEVGGPIRQVGTHTNDSTSIGHSVCTFVCMYVCMHCGVTEFRPYFLVIISHKISLIVQNMGRDSSVRTGNRYGLDVQGIEFPHPSRPNLDPTQPPVQCIPRLFHERVNRQAPGFDHPLPSSARQMLELSIYLCSVL